MTTAFPPKVARQAPVMSARMAGLLRSSVRVSESALALMPVKLMDAGLAFNAVVT